MCGTFRHNANVHSMASDYSAGTLEDANLMQGYHSNTYNHRKQKLKIM